MLKTAVTDAAKLIELEVDKEYIIQTAGRMEKIPYRDIFYIQRDGGKNSAICSTVGTSKVRKSLQQVFEELTAPEFIFIDRGCIVNIIQIMKVAGGMAFLKNGEALPVSRSHLQAVKQQINKFWGTHI
jgi:DNA-binding LytR/AlgR family response regulator